MFLKYKKADATNTSDPTSSFNNAHSGVTRNLLDSTLRFFLNYNLWHSSKKFIPIACMLEKMLAIIMRVPSRVTLHTFLVLRLYTPT